MTPALVTIIASFVVIVGINVFLYLSGRTTISATIGGAAEEWPLLALLVAFGMGLLAGHWFW